MLKGAYDETTLSEALLKADDLLAAGDQTPSEAEGEILTYVMRNQNNGERTSIEEIVRNFARRPYGWYSMAVLTLVGRLFRLGRVELRATELLDARGAYDRLRNSRQHGSVRVRLQQQFDSTEVTALKTFHQDFFDRTNLGTDARAVGEYTAQALDAEARDLSLLVDQVDRYPFLGELKPVAERLVQLAGKDYTFLLKNRSEFEDDLLTAKDDLLSPIKTFMHGPQRAVYDEANAFLREEEANFAELPPAEVQPLRDLSASPRPYHGNIVPTAKAAVAKLRRLLTDLLKTERDRALAIVDAHLARLQATEDYSNLADSEREQVLAPTNAARSAIAAARFVAVIRARVGRYAAQEYPAQLALAAQLGTTRNSAAGDAPQAAITYIPASGLRPKCDLPYLASTADLDQWLTALRTAAQAELNKGNRITL
jgi:hypothetical protein